MLFPTRMSRRAAVQQCHVPSGESLWNVELWCSHDLASDGAWYDAFLGTSRCLAANDEYPIDPDSSFQQFGRNTDAIGTFSSTGTPCRPSPPLGT